MKVIYFYHNGKCGGSYCLALLKRLTKVSKGKFVSFNNLTEDKKMPQLDENIKSFIGKIKDYPKNTKLLIHHHHGYPGMVELYDQLIKLRLDLERQGDELIMFTTTRNPLSYLISKLNFNNQRGFSLTYKKYLEEDVYYNQMSKYLLYNHMDRWDKKNDEVSIDLVKKHLQLFDYVFPIKGISHIEDILNTFLGKKGVRPPKKVNVGNKDSFPTEEQKQKLTALNQIDAFLYSFAQEQLANYIASPRPDPTQSKIVLLFNRYLNKMLSRIGL